MLLGAVMLLCLLETASIEEFRHHRQPGKLRVTAGTQRAEAGLGALSYLLPNTIGIQTE